jgi:hypothetical protein
MFDYLMNNQDCSYVYLITESNETNNVIAVYESYDNALSNWHDGQYIIGPIPYYKYSTSLNRCNPKQSPDQSPRLSPRLSPKILKKF